MGVGIWVYMPDECVCVHVWPKHPCLRVCLLSWRGCVFVVEMWRCCEWTVKRAIRERRPLIRTELLLYFTYLTHTHTHTNTETDRHTAAQIAGGCFIILSASWLMHASVWAHVQPYMCGYASVCICVYRCTQILVLKCICAYK